MEAASIETSEESPTNANTAKSTTNSTSLYLCTSTGYSTSQPPPGWLASVSRHQLAQYVVLLR